jgi:hypothetical protein
MMTRLDFTNPTTILWQPIPAIPATRQPALTRLLQRFAPIDLSHMDSVALMDRNDTKFLLNLEQLINVLPGLTPHYWILDINKVRLSHYQTLYFDTPDFALYKSHHAQARDRYKVRSRRYASTDRAFIEVKSKTGHDRTAKRRIETGRLAANLTPEMNDFINAGNGFPIDSHQLEPRLWNDYSRITLVNKYLPERVTLDLNLEFNSDTAINALPGLVIAEVKQDQVNRESAFMQQMRSRQVRPTSFSKYCIGVCLLFDEVKHNNFKPQLRLIDKTLATRNTVRGH